MRRGEALDLVNGYLVVAVDAQVQPGIDFTQPLNEVVCERVVVVDEEDHAQEVEGGRPSAVETAYRIQPTAYFLSRHQSRGMRFAVNQGKNFRLIDGRVSLGRAVDVECGLRFPALGQ